MEDALRPPRLGSIRAVVLVVAAVAISYLTLGGAVPIGAQEKLAGRIEGLLPIEADGLKFGIARAYVRIDAPLPIVLNLPLTHNCKVGSAVPLFRYLTLVGYKYEVDVHGCSSPR